ncbi:hypothetical protein [Dokdonella sp.]|uniref:hypothetical protein n=1 Tax=Dokdonella sp. TaxID=2291710 RepID=UPI001B0C934D|nr:hypothetical protein [Dokdonella sp.]MBO9663547.1 hypothetical protein [Dokdonella sp.]
MRSKLFLLAVFGLLQAAWAGAAEIWVGAGPSCTTASLGEAIASARTSVEPDTIRIATDQPYEDQSVRIDTSVELIGGYGSCGAEDRSGYTPLFGTGTMAVVTIDGGSSGAGIDVRLDRLDVSGGGADARNVDSGGLSIRGAARVRLSDSIIHHNDASLVERASSGRGGGVALNGALASLVIERAVDIHDNTASGGAGLSVVGGRVRILPHGVTIRHNLALDGGGGVLILDRGSVIVRTDPKAPELPVDGVVISHNRAGGSGGGILLGGPDAELLADQLVVQGNHAQTLGSALYVGYQGKASLARSAEPGARDCPPELQCLRLSDNGPNNTVHVTDGGSLLLDGVVVRESVNEHSLISVGAHRSRLRITGSLVSNSAPTSCYYHLVGMWGGTFEFEHSTFVRSAPACVWTPLVHAYGADLDGTHVIGRSSLVSGYQKIFRPPSNSPDYSEHYDCVLKDRGDPEPAAERSEVAPIQFVDMAGADFRLTADNLAIDYCDDSAPSSRQADLDRQPRGEDSATHANRYGTYDLGAYEFGGNPDRIFANGFEARF